MAEGDLVLAAREPLRDGHAEGEVLVGEGEVEISDVHLIPRLLAEGDGAPRVRVVRVLGRVVEVRFGVKDRPFGHRLGLVEDVEVLPVELVPGDVEEDLAAPVGVLGDEPHRLAPQVHVRHQREQHRGPREPEIGPRDVVARPGRDLEAEVERHARHQFFVDRRRVGEDEADPAPVDLLRPPGRVVELEDDLRSGRDALRHAVAQDARRHPGGVGGEEVAAGLVDLLDAGRQDEGDDVVDDRRVPRPDLGGPDPDVLRQLRVNLDELVRHRPPGRDLDLAGHLQDEVGPGDLPSLDESSRRGQVGRVSFRRAGGDPVADRLFLDGREPGVVGKLSVLGRGVPGRHPTLVDNLGNHARPAGRLAVVGQGERGDLARSVAGDAVRLKDARDLSRIRHGSAIGRLRGPADRAADRRCPRRRDRSPGEDRLEGVDQVVPGGRRSMDADGVLIVDPAPIDDGSRPIQDEDLGRPLGPKAVGQAIADVLEDRERQIVLVGEPADRDRSVLLVGVDAEEANASLLEIAGDLGQPRSIGLGQGALGPQEREHDDLPVTSLVKRVPGSPVVLKSEVDRRLRRFARPHQADQHHDSDEPGSAHLQDLCIPSPIPKNKPRLDHTTGVREVPRVRPQLVCCRFDNTSADQTDERRSTAEGSVLL